MRLQIQQLKVDISTKTVYFSFSPMNLFLIDVNHIIQKEVSRLRGMGNVGVDNQDMDTVSMGCPASPISLKWDGLNGSFTPLTIQKKPSKV